MTSSRSNAKPKTELKADYMAEFNAESDLDADGAESSGSVRRAEQGEDFARLLGESLKGAARKLKVGDKVKGKILVLGQEDVFVSTGTQHDGVIAKRDLLEADGTCKYQQDDVIELYVTQVRGSDVRLSRSPTDRNLAEDLEDAYDMMLPVQGRIVEVCKGGVRVNVKGKLAFCPISQIDIAHVENAEDYVGRSLEFRITKFAEGGRNIVVSRRKLLEEERELNAGSFLEENKDGDIVSGRVARLEKFGAFVELAPGVDGLVHISEIAWSRIGDPSEVLQVGQEVMVKLLKRETMGDRVKISLSIKQASDRPLPAPGVAPLDGTRPGASGSAGLMGNDPFSQYGVGQVFSGTIQRKEVYGLFVQLAPGVTGLLHQSKISDHPELRMEKLKVGDTLSVQVGEVKPGERRISLELPRDPGEDDWRKHVQATASFGTLGGAFGEKLKSAMSKKK